MHGEEDFVIEMCTDVSSNAIFWCIEQLINYQYSFALVMQFLSGYDVDYLGISKCLDKHL